MHKKALLPGMIVLVSALLAANAARTPRCKDMINGNGKLVAADTNGPVQFMFRAKSVEGTLSGILKYRDRAQQIKLKSKELVEYIVLDDVSRRMKFLVRDSEGLPHEVTVLACDFDASGSDDVVEIYLPDGTPIIRELQKGNIRLRTVHCGTVE